MMSESPDIAGGIEEEFSPPSKPWYRPDFSLRNILLIGVFGVLGIILNFISIPLPLPVPGLGAMTFGFTLVPPFLIGMTLGPIPGVLTEVVEGIGFDIRFGTFPIFTITAAINAPTWWTLVWWFTGRRYRKWRKPWWCVFLIYIFHMVWLKLTLIYITFPFFLQIPVGVGITTLYILPSGWLKGSISAIADGIVTWALFSRKQVRKALGVPD